MNTGLWNMDSGLAALRRPGMTTEYYVGKYILRRILYAIPLAFSIGFAMGALAGSFPGTWIDRVVTGGAVFGVSLPSYWLGIVLVIVFAVELSILPATGMGLQGSSEFNPLRWSDARFL